MVLATGCGEDAAPDQSSSRGASSATEGTSIENAYLVPNFAPGSCAIQVGDSGQLKFTMVNSRESETERLLGISTDAADSVVMKPTQVEILSGGSVSADLPVADAADTPLNVTVEGLNDKARPGISVSFTFRFQTYGDLKMQVPIEACPTQS